MPTLANSIREWMQRYKKTSVKIATFDRLTTSLVSLERYPIAQTQIDQLTSDSIQEYINEMVEDGYSLSTIKKQFHLITAFITYANLSGAIDKPIHKSVTLPTQSMVRRAKREVVSYSLPEQTALKRELYAAGHPACSAALLMLETGLRVGEALALSWSDVDWQRKALRVRKTIVRLGSRKKQYIQQEAKSYSSNRTVPLSSTAASLLREILAASEDKFGLIFRDSTGSPLSYETVRWHVSQACLKADVPYYGLHAFRHTFATNCYNRGCNVKLLSRLLGHADVSVTYNVYIHLYGDALEEMRGVIE